MTGVCHAFARHDVGEHLNGTSLLQAYGLARHILIAGADAGIAHGLSPRFLPEGIARIVR